MTHENPDIQISTCTYKVLRERSSHLFRAACAPFQQRCRAGRTRAHGPKSHSSSLLALYRKSPQACDTSLLLPEETQGHFEERLHHVKKEDTSSIESNRGDVKREPSRKQIKKKRPWHSWPETSSHLPPGQDKRKGRGSPIVWSSQDTRGGTGFTLKAFWQRIPCGWNNKCTVASL